MESDCHGDPEGHRKSAGVLQEKGGGHEFYEFPGSTSSPQKATEPHPHNHHYTKTRPRARFVNMPPVPHRGVRCTSTQKGSDGKQGRVGFNET